MRLVLGQTGAPTAVVNRSVAGFLAGVHGHQVLAARGGPDALVNGSLEALTHEGMPAGTESQGGSWLGGGRRSITETDLDRIVSVLSERGIDGLCLIGGNGTMALLAAIAERAARRGVPLRAVGIPKTIDNDLDGVDHAPGFASAARFLTTLMPDIARDHRAMTSVEPVRIVETMGRSTGWLALAATLPTDPDHPVHRVYVPELPFDRDDFLADVRRLVNHHGRALIVVSEGVAPELTALPVHETNHTALLVGGVARELAAIVTTELGLPSRGEVIGVLQRCAAPLASETDVREAAQVGRRAAQALTSTGDDVPSAVMVGLSRTSTDPYRVEFPLLPLDVSAGRVRKVPPGWRATDPRDLHDFHRWLAPLVRSTSTTAAAPVTTALEAS